MSDLFPPRQPFTFSSEEHRRRYIAMSKYFSHIVDYQQEAINAYKKQVEADFPDTEIHYPKSNTNPPKPRQNAEYSVPHIISGTTKR